MQLSASVAWWSVDFIAIAIAGMFFGPVPAALVGFCSDILATLLIPHVGSFFPGFTLSAILIGILYGVILYKKKFSYLRIILAKIFEIVLIGLLLNSLWISLMQHIPYWAMVISRAGVKLSISLPVEAAIITLILFSINTLKKQGVLK